MLGRLLFLAASCVSWLISWRQASKSMLTSESAPRRARPSGLPPLIGLTGRSGAGKDTAAKALIEKGWRRVAFADRVRLVALAIDPIIEWDGDRLSECVARDGWDVAKKRHEVRRLLQAIGTDGVRRHVAENAWVSACRADIQRARAEGFPVVVTDVRFINEASMIHDLGGKVIEVDRGEATLNQSLSSHESEVGIPDVLIDSTLFNFGSIDYLRANVIEAVKELEIGVN